MSVREMLARGEFNSMSQARQPDGSVLITLIKRGDPHRYTMLVRDLYGPNEIVLREETDVVYQ